MATTCPKCQQRGGFTLTPTGQAVIPNPGSEPIANLSVEYAARPEYRLTHRCGWTTTGYVDDGHLVIQTHVLHANNARTLP